MRSQSNTRVCSHCQVLYPATEEYFYACAKTGGLEKSCKACRRLESNRWAQQHRQHIRDYQRRYRTSNVEERRAYVMAHREENAARMRAYAAAHPEEVKAKKRLYNAAHKEQRRAYLAIKRSERESVLRDWAPDGCLVCGWSDLRAIDAHHIDPTEKERAVSSSINPRAVKEELRKCRPLCRNHHAVLHSMLHNGHKGASTDELIAIMRQEST